MITPANRDAVKKLVEDLAMALVDNADEVYVQAVESTGSGLIVFELSVNRKDLGKIIGKDGRLAKAMRLILSSVGAKHRCRYSLEILE